MDEPFSALDEPTRYGMQDLIVELWTEIDATIMLVSHSIQEAVYLGDRVWVIGSAPGTIVSEFADVPIPTPDIPAMVAQSRPEFADATHQVSQAFLRMLRTPREELKPVAATGVGRTGLVGGDE
jgi:NitT/TauT family transport system ATP-binding protein